MSTSVLARQEHSQFQLTITIPADQIKTAYQQILKQAAADIELPGFRKGKAPLDKAESHLDKNKLLEQVLAQLLPKAYTQAIAEHQLQPIIDPQINLLKPLDADQDWQIRLISAEKPLVKLAGYQAKIKGLLKSVDIWTPDKGHHPDPQSAHNQTKPSPEELKTLQSQKLMDWLLQNIEIEPAPILIEQHANQLLAQLLDQIQKLGLTLNQYLSSLNKKVDDLKAEYVQRARQNLQLEFILLAIGESEKITVSDQEIASLIDQSDDKIRQELQKPEQKHQLYNLIFRQKVIDLLFKLAS